MCAFWYAPARSYVHILVLTRQQTTTPSLSERARARAPNVFYSKPRARSESEPQRFFDEWTPQFAQRIGRARQRAAHFGLGLLLVLILLLLLVSSFRLVVTSARGAHHRAAPARDRRQPTRRCGAVRERAPLHGGRQRNHGQSPHHMFQRNRNSDARQKYGGLAEIKFNVKIRLQMQNAQSLFAIIIRRSISESKTKVQNRELNSFERA